MSMVYFIKPVGLDGPIKIGCSATPELRRQQLQSWSPFDLTVVAMADGGRFLEDRMHAYFIDDHIRQEWFRASARMDAMIASINDGSFDESILPDPVGMIRHAAKAKKVSTPLAWEYRKAFGLFKAIPWPYNDGLGWPAAPCIVEKYSVTRQQTELAKIKSRLAAAGVSAPSQSGEAA